MVDIEKASTAPTIPVLEEIKKQPHSNIRIDNLVLRYPEKSIKVDQPKFTKIKSIGMIFHSANGDWKNPFLNQNANQGQ